MKPRLKLEFMLLAALLVSSSMLTVCAARPAPAAKKAAVKQLPRVPPEKLPPRKPAELSNSFIITTIQDLEPQLINGVLQTPCEYAVKRARSIGGKHFSLVVTAHWQGDAHRVQRYAYKSVDSSGVQFLPPTNALINKWKKGMQTCLRAAVLGGFTGIQVLNHIDHDQGSWRNEVDMHPTERYEGYTYEDVVVRPAADALRTVTRPSTKVWFMIAGEMGRSVWKYPDEYLRLTTKYRGTLARGKTGANVKVGIALHWNKVCGNCFDMPQGLSTTQYNASYAKGYRDNKARIASQYNLPSLRRLFEVVDVLGISHYAPMPQQMTYESFELPYQTCAYEMSFFGINLKKLVTQNKKDFLFSEVGVGGGSHDGRSTAEDLRSLMQYTERGIWAVYNVAQDPWKRPDYRAYRRVWFQNLLGFLRHRGGPHVKVDAAFVWSVGSFDVAAVHPISMSPEGTYADAEIVGWMQELSSKVAI